MDGQNDSKTLRVEANIFKNREKDLRSRKLYYTEAVTETLRSNGEYDDSKSFGLLIHDDLYKLTTPGTRECTGTF